MNIIAFIPSRYGSTRFPGKPLALIAGKPMIQHAYQCAKKCTDILEVYVTTDDERIMQRVLQFKGKAIMTAKGHRSGSDRIAEAALKLGLNDDDLIINIQGDQPIFSPSLISDMVKPLIDDPEIPMGTIKYLIKDEDDISSSNIVKVVTDEKDFALYFSRHAIPFYREPGSPQCYYKHLGFYAYRMRFLLAFSRLPKGILENAENLEQLRALEHGFRIKVVEVKQDSIEVDTPEDRIKVEEILLKSQC
ncbi:MAG: 3-deoxy-manno-octulosonate cytidylyltransferase [Deltaproteobacteria bacterium]|nr:3-deoxy-manno-octulosonate cytidylyltransferase [Deltaproteobacteria bacterium]